MVITTGPVPEAQHYVGAAIGRPTPFPMDVIEACLWEVAVSGGNVAKAMRTLRATDEANGVVRELPADKTVRTWVTSQYRNRFHEITQGRARELEELVAANAVELALESQEIKRDALKQIAATMAGVDAVEASTILRNVANSTKSDLDGAMGIRRQAAQAEDSRTIRHMADALVRLGVGSIREVDGSATEVTDADIIEGE